MSHSNELTAESLFCQSLPMLPRAWDSTMLGLYKTCARKFFYTIVLGYQSASFAVHLSFGIAGHKGLEIYHKLRAQGADHIEALREVIKFTMSWGFRESDGTFRPYNVFYTQEPTKTRETLTRTLIWYLDHYKNDPAKTYVLSNGAPAVELSFKLPLPDFHTPDGDEFLLCGNLDRVAEVDGHLYFLDLKTTKSQLNSFFFAQFSPNNQMSLYYTAAQVILREPVRGGFIDGAQIGVGFSRFARHLIYRTPDQQREWLEDTKYYINLAMQNAADENFPMNDTACNDYGGCPFRSICSKDRRVRKGFLEHEGYLERKWNPLESR